MLELQTVLSTLFGAAVGGVLSWGCTHLYAVRAERELRRRFEEVAKNFGLLGGSVVEVQKKLEEALTVEKKSGKTSADSIGLLAPLAATLLLALTKKSDGDD
ncbi:hypothetical protein [Brevundimonas sp.]|uniref:hypothetical protein n=1 Tax=Brevundimonas sp. TaxID=1871086 RepID=UPI00391D6D48